MRCTISVKGIWSIVQLLQLVLYLIFILHASEMRQIPEILARRSEDGSVTWNTFSFNFKGHVLCLGIEEKLADPSGNVISMLNIEVPVTRHDVHTCALALPAKHELIRFGTASPA